MRLLPLLLVLAISASHAFVPQLSMSLKSTSSSSRGTTSSPVEWLHQASQKAVQKAVMVGIVAVTLGQPVVPYLPLPSPPVAVASEDKRTVGEIAASGFVFKDTLTVEAFNDPKVEGVSIYVSDFTKPITEKLSSAKNFFSDPSSASMTCARTGPMKVGDINTSKDGEEVFSESRSVFFKSIKVRRLYDKDADTLVYVSYADKLDKTSDSNKSRFKSSMCAVHVQ